MKYLCICGFCLLAVANFWVYQGNDITDTGDFFRSTKEGLLKEHFDQQLEMSLAPIISADREVIDSAKPVKLTSVAGQPLDGDEGAMLTTDSDSFSGRSVAGFIFFSI